MIRDGAVSFNQLCNISIVLFIWVLLQGNIEAFDLSSNFSMLSQGRKLEGSRKYSFKIMLWQDTKEGKKPQDPYHNDFHMTRYAHDPQRPQASNYQYTQLIPWIRQFDLVVANCIGGSTTCIYSFDSSRQAANGVVIKVHVNADYRHHKFFFEKMLPFFERRFEESGDGIILFSGSSDRSVSFDSARTILGSKSVFRWGMENNVIECIDSDPRIVQIPLGFGIRQNIGETAVELRKYISEWANNTVASWNRRKERVLFCFVGEYGDRPRWMDWAQRNCTICDVCNSTEGRTQLPQSLLWRTYLEYKFVFSPLGHGSDCHRTFEIVAMGAIPIVPYYAGLRAYSFHGNMSIISVRGWEEITESALKGWVRTYTHSSDPKTLTKEYWDHVAFDGVNKTYPPWPTYAPSIAPSEVPSLSPTAVPSAASTSIRLRRTRQ
jgi:hypothetical protein